MTATYEQALSRRTEAQVLLRQLTGIRPVSVGVSKHGRTWVVKVGVTRAPLGEVPSEVGGVPLVVNLVNGAVALGSKND